MKKKILFLDFFRPVCAFCVFLFHSNIHIGARYGIFAPFVSVSALFMTAFFMLSGFVLSYNYSDSDLTEISAYFSFIKKRIIGIYPGYICVYVFFILGRFLKHEGFSFGDIVATPVELVLLQSVFAGSFSTLHNGGTWFISCIFVCYCLFPFFQKIFRQMNGKVTAIFLVFFYLVSSYAPVVRYFLNYFSIYANVFFRFVEFSIGMILGNLFVKREFCCVKRSSLNKSVGVCAVVGGGGAFLVSVTTIFLKIGIPNLEYLLFNFFCIPIFGAMIFFGSAMNFEFLCGKAKKILEYLSRISYEFFLAQFFTFDIFKFIQKNVQAEFSSFMRFLISFSTCILISILMHEFFSMPLKKLLNSSFKKRKN